MKYLLAPTPAPVGLWALPEFPNNVQFREVPRDETRKLFHPGYLTGYLTGYVKGDGTDAGKHSRRAV
jgi:hypothetical protein